MKAIANFKSDSGYRVNAHTMRTTAFHRPRGTGLVLALVAIILFAGSALIAHGIAQAGGTEPLAKPAVSAKPVPGAAVVIDHSSLATSTLLPEPDASLLHSEPNAYVNANGPAPVKALRAAL